ncbi:MAG: matrixin family metalloprotease [Myxococcales bacterium]|nr:matrixin family metalloprotease [Myxococcales bacterium]
MHRTIAAIACLLSFGLIAADADAFCLRKLPGYKEYPKWTKSISYYVSDNLTDQKILAAIDAAFATWSAVKCSTLTFQKGGSFKLSSKFEDPGKEGIFIFWHQAEAGFPSQAQYVSYTYFGVDAKGNLNLGSIAINDFKYEWATDGKSTALDVQGEITALIGRALAINDSDAANSVMTQSLKFGDTSKRTLQPDDEDAVSYLYPASGCTTPTAPGANDCNGGNAGSNPTTPPAADGGGSSGGDGGGGSTTSPDAGASGDGGSSSGGGGSDDSGSGGNSGGGNSGGNNGGGNNGGGSNSGGCTSQADCPTGSICTVEGMCVDVSGNNNSNGNGNTAPPVQGGGCSLGPDADAPLTLSLILLICICGLLVTSSARRRRGI